MEQIKLFISLPFRIDGKSEELPDAIFDFDAVMMRRYIEALKKEIVSASVQDCVVSKIEFGIGSYCHFLTEDLEALYDLICQNFKMDPKVSVVLNATSGGFSFYRLMCAKHLHQARIRFEIPCMDDAGLKKAGYRSTVQDMESAMAECFQRGYPNVECRIDPKYAKDSWKDTIEKIIRGKVRNLSFATKPKKEQLNEAKEVFNSFDLDMDEICIFEVSDESAFQNQIGCGLNAITEFDGIVFKTTSDFELYCQFSDEFDRIAIPIKK